MRLQLTNTDITRPKYFPRCIVCGGPTGSQGDASKEVYADLDGPAFRAYMHGGICKARYARTPQQFWGFVLEHLQNPNLQEQYLVTDGPVKYTVYVNRLNIPPLTCDCGVLEEFQPCCHIRFILAQ